MSLGEVGRDSSQSPSLETVWRLRSWEVKLKGVFEEGVLAVIWGWLGLYGVGRSCSAADPAPLGFCGVIRAAAARGASLPSANMGNTRERRRLQVSS